MYNLIKAELYRLRHSGLYAFFMFVTAIAMAALLPIMMNPKEYIKADLASSVFTFSQVLFAMIVLCTTTVLGVYVGTLYNNRMANYEVMNGYPTFKIITSKSLSLGFIHALITYIPMMVVLLIPALKNGNGLIEEPVKMFILLFVIILHCSIVTVLYSMFFKNLVFASLLGYVRFGILDMVPTVIIVEEFPKLAEKEALNISISQQCMSLVRDTYDQRFILWVVLSMIVESAILFGLVYYSYTRKKFR